MTQNLPPPGERLNAGDTELYSELISNASHQIINPLTAVVGTIDNLADGTIREDRRVQRLRMAEAQLSYAIELTRNLAYLSQLMTQDGRQKLRESRNRTLLPEIIIEAAMFFQELAQSEKGMEIFLSDPKTPYVVRGDRDLLRQVFTNLFDNAIKYGAEGTRVTIDIHVQRKTGQLIVEVKNFGIGFDFDEREKIFERGTRGSKAMNIKASGTGLGLYLCREILDVGFRATIEGEHSGVHSETIFRVRFPEFTLDDGGSHDF
jgi:signal transduction histidine kinase